MRSVSKSSQEAAAAAVVKFLVLTAAMTALLLRTTTPVVVHSFAVVVGTARPPRRPTTTSSSSSSLSSLYLFKDFFQELDKFLDDASARRLGNGAAFYGKRKSNFYGPSDKNKKVNTSVPDPTEDYQAPNTGGYFQWMTDEQGQMRPVTRMKKKIVERNMKFWDNVYDDDNDDDTNNNNDNDTTTGTTKGRSSSKK